MTDRGILKHIRRLEFHKVLQVALIALQYASAIGNGPALLCLVREPFLQVEQTHVNGVRIDLNCGAAIVYVVPKCRRVESEAARL